MAVLLSAPQNVSQAKVQLQKKLDLDPTAGDRSRAKPSSTVAPGEGARPATPSRA